MACRIRSVRCAVHLPLGAVLDIVNRSPREPAMNTKSIGACGCMSFTLEYRVMQKQEEQGWRCRGGWGLVRDVVPATEARERVASDKVACSDLSPL